MSSFRKWLLQLLLQDSILILILLKICHYLPVGKGKLPKRPLGKTGHMVGIYSLGGQATIETPGKEELSVQIINRAIDLGINYIDTAAWYGRPTAYNYTGRGTWS